MRKLILILSTYCLLLISACDAQVKINNPLKEQEEKATPETESSTSIATDDSSKVDPKQSWQEVEQASNELWQKSKKMGSDVWISSKEKSNKAWQQGKDSSQQLWDDSVEKSQQLWQQGKDGSIKTWNNIESSTKQGWDKSTDKAQQFMDEMEDRYFKEETQNKPTGFAHDEI